MKISLEKIVAGTLISGIPEIMSCTPDYAVVEQPEETCIWTDALDQPLLTDGVDILWIIDTSGSMYDDQDRLLTGIDTMMNALPTTSWRLNMISADPTMVIYDQQFPLVPGNTIADAWSMYTLMSKGPLEEGFAAAMTYIDQNSYAKTWMRNTATLLIVFVSDEEEQSFYGVTDAVAISTFETWFDATRYSRYIASIVHLSEDQSLCEVNSIDVGDRYIEVTNNYNGVIIDICSEDWSSGVEDVSEELTLYDSWPLTYTPQEGTLAVFVNDAVYPESKWVHDAEQNIVLFKEIPDYGSHIDISYNIDKSTYPETECPSDVK